jgi:lipopolysaccharide export system protein LptC
MTSRMRIDKLVAWSPVLLLGGLAALTYWLDAQIQPSTARRDGATRHDPDMYIDSFSGVTFGADGSVLQSLAAKRAQHYPDDDSIDLSSPRSADRPRQAAADDRRGPRHRFRRREVVTSRQRRARRR